MKTFSGKSSRDNQNAHFLSNKFFLKIVSFVRQCGRMWQSCTRHGHSMTRRMRIAWRSG